MEITLTLSIETLEYLRELLKREQKRLIMEERGAYRLRRYATSDPHKAVFDHKADIARLSQEFCTKTLERLGNNLPN